MFRSDRHHDVAVTTLRSLTAAVLLILLGLLSLLALPATALPTARPGLPSPPTSTVWAWPLEPVPAVVHGFDPPAERWGAGHRGVDLLGSAAQPVMSIAAGEVTVAKPVAGRGVVVVSHGALRSTYEPVTASVHVGQHIDAGQVIGLLQTTRSHCLPAVCLHLGLRRGRVYLDPLSVLGPRPVRLKPLTLPGQPDDDHGGLAPPPDTPRPVAAPQSSAGGEPDPQPWAAPAAALGAGTAVGLALLVSSRLGRGHARG